MLGPASFVNHCCTPNAKFECGGQTKGQTVVRIETTRDIMENKESLVEYSKGYFGKNNEDFQDFISAVSQRVRCCDQI